MRYLLIQAENIFVRVLPNTIEKSFYREEAVKALETGIILMIMDLKK